MVGSGTDPRNTFPECVEKGSRLGSGGGEVFARRYFCLRNRLQRLQPSATVRDEVAMAVPLGSAAEVVTVGGFKRCVPLFRVAGVALRDIPTCFTTCRNSFCVIRAVLSHLFQKASCIFSGRRSTLETSIVILRGRRSTLDESRCVVFVHRSVKTASSGGNLQIRGRRCIL